MNVEQLRTNLRMICKQIGASFTLDEAEGEISLYRMRHHLVASGTSRIG